MVSGWPWSALLIICVYKLLWTSNDIFRYGGALTLSILHTYTRLVLSCA